MKMGPLLGFMNMLLELPGGRVGGKHRCVIAVLLIALEGTVDMKNLAFKTLTTLRISRLRI